MSLFEIGNKVMFFTGMQITHGIILEIEQHLDDFWDKSIILDTGSQIVYHETNENCVVKLGKIRLYDEKVFTKVQANFKLINKLKEQNKDYFK